MRASHVGLVVVALIVLSLVVGVPARVGYVTSGSMAPSLSAGDGYVLVTVDEPRPGDIVTYRSDAQGELVTHRIVDETADGYLTRGDANPTTDQAAGIDPVDRSQILGTVLTIGGTPLAVPGLGGLVTALSQHVWAVVAVAGIVAVLSGGTAIPTRSVVYVRDVAHPVLGVVFVGCFVALLVASSTYHLSWLVVDDAPDAVDELPAGEQTTRTVHVDLAKPPITHAVVEADGMTVLQRTTTGSRLDLRVRMPSRARGAYTTTVRVYPYPAVLPRSTLVDLHRIHPVAAVLASLGVVFGPVFALYGAFFQGRTPIRLADNRWLDRLGGEAR